MEGAWLQHGACADSDGAGWRSNGDSLLTTTRFRFANGPQTLRSRSARWIKGTAVPLHACYTVRW